VPRHELGYRPAFEAALRPGGQIGVHVAEWVIEPASPGLDGIAEVFAEVNFRPDLLADLATARRLGGEIFVAVADGTVVGVSSAVAFGVTGWIGGVAVRPSMGRRGIGEQLTRHAEQALYERGARTSLLHATPSARPLYARMGFVDDWQMVELRGPGGPPPPAATSTALPPITIAVRPATAADLPAVLALDRAATGEERTPLFADVWPRGALVATVDGRLQGFGLRTTGRSLGAVIAEADAVGEALVRASMAVSEGEQRIGMPADHKALQAALGRLGFAVHGYTTRMHHGPAPRAIASRIHSVFNLYWG
jgi:predicted N-acetyltransferase YhbS